MTNISDRKKKILFLQGPYSFFFRDLGRMLRGHGCESVYAVFNPGDSFLASGMKKIPWKALLSEEAEFARGFRFRDNYLTARKARIEKAAVTKKENALFRAYYAGVKKFLAEEGISLILMQNDTRWQHAYAIEAAEDAGVPCFVFELGLFRPNTITMDPRGVNFNNSVPRDLKACTLTEAKKIVYSEHTDSRISEAGRNLILAFYLLCHFLGSIAGVNAPENKKIRVRDYIKRFAVSYLGGRKKPDTAAVRGNYLFAPFQVMNDSQSLLYSPYEDMTEFAEDVIRGVREYNAIDPDAALKAVFKEHPMDRGVTDFSALREKYRGDEGVLILGNGNIDDLIRDSAAVITINSTVGLDALKQGKRVICMGKAFYAVEGIAFSGQKGSVCDALRASMRSEPDAELIGRYMSYLKNVYQVEGNEYFYNEKQLGEIAGRIIRRLREKA